MDVELAVILKMKAASVGKYDRVFVHFIPKEPNKTCHFFVKDHNPVFPLNQITYTLLNKEEQEQVTTCHYQVNVGVAMLDENRTNIFSFHDFVEETKNGFLKNK